LPNNPLFSLGRVVSTPAALKALEGAGASPLTYLSRHQYGDYGDLSSDDLRANQRAIEDGSRILSAYQLTTGKRVWIITDAADSDGHRLATTILLPEEY
jgi:hypothetical protein